MAGSEHSPEQPTNPVEPVDLTPLHEAPPDEPDFAGARPGRRPRTMMVVLAGLAVLVVLAGGGAFAALKLRSGGGTLPEDAVPASTAAFVRVNLSPGFSQRVKFEALLKKFPAPNRGGDRLGEMKRDLFKEFDESLSYDEVEPWFGDRLGVGAWTNDGRLPVTLLALASSDDGKARQALTKVRDQVGAERMGFVVADGYAIVVRDGHGAQATAEAAVKAARQASLASNPTFRATAGRLPADQALLGWVDFAQIGALSKAMLPGVDEELPANSSVGVVPEVDRLKGFLAFGAMAVQNGIEVHGRWLGAERSTAPATDVRSQLDAMPGDSIVAAVMPGGMGELGAIAALGGFLALGQSASASGAFLSWGVSGGGAPDSMPSPPPGWGSDEMASPPPGWGLDEMPSPPPGWDPGELPSGVPGLVPSPPPGWTPGELPPDAPFPLTPEEQAAIKADAALAEAFGTAKMITLAVSRFETGSSPVVRMTLQLANEAAAKQLTADLAGHQPADELSAQQQGDRVEVWSKDYVAGPGRLADQARYRAAMSGGPSTPNCALYIDGAALAAAMGHEEGAAGWLAPIKAVGFSSGRVGDTVVAVGRIIIE